MSSAPEPNEQEGSEKANSETPLTLDGPQPNPAPGEWIEATPGEFKDVADASRRHYPTAGTAAEPTTLPSEGSTVSRLLSVPGYEIVEEVGHGGMGVVYKARHLRLNRLVALKMIVAGAHARPETRVRFLAEAETVARLQHPNIVQIYEVNQHDGIPYIALEYVDGGTLHQKLRSAPLPIRDTVELIEVLARAVHAAHEKGIIHRDLKPANILLTHDGKPKIADFGLAKHVESGVGVTQTGEILGTPTYMAPEQAGGGQGWVGPAVDVYALGVILYEMLAGRPPFRGLTPMETLRKVVDDEPEGIRRLQPDVPRNLEAICLKAIAKEPARRYASALDFADDLRRYLLHEPVRARPVGPFARGFTWLKRKRTIALSALGGATLLSAVALILYLLFKPEAPPEAPPAGPSYFDLIARANAEWDVDNLDRAEEALDACPQDQRHWEWYYLKNQCRTGRQVLMECPKAVTAVAFSDSHAACGSADGTVRVKHLTTGEARTLAGHFDWVQTVALRGDGRRLASGSRDKTVKVWNTDTGKCELTFTGHADRVTGVAFSPDGRIIASASYDRTVKVWEAATGKEITTFAKHGRAVNGVAFSADGEKVASVSDDSKVRLWEAQTGNELACFEDHTAATTGVAFSPDGRRLASSARNETIHVRDLIAGRRILTLHGHSRAVNGVAFSAAGERIASVSEDKSVRLWDAQTGRELFAFKGHKGATTGVAFHPDRQHVASASEDGTVRLWDISNGQGTITIAAHDEAVRSLVFSHDNGCLASAGRDAKVKLWNPTNGKTLRTFGEHTDLVTGVAFSPDARRVASASHDGTVKIWDPDTGTVERAFAEPGGKFYSVAISPDGRFVAAGAMREVKIWDVITGVELATLRGHGREVPRVAFHPGGHILASASFDGTVRIWDVPAMKELFTLTGHGDRVPGVAFSPDGTILASTSVDQTVKLWNVETGQEIRTLSGHTGAITGVAFSPDGLRLTTASQDQTVKVWDSHTGRELLTLKGHTAGLNTVAFSPNGQMIASGGRDQTIRLWKAER